MWATLYFLIAFVLWFPLYKGLYRQHRREFPILEWDNGDRIFAVIWGAFVCVLWPLFLPIFALGWVIVKAKPLLERLEN